MSLAPITVTVNSCARCRENHSDLKFEPLTYPHGWYTHWAPCPNVNEPILLQISRGLVADEVLKSLHDHGHDLTDLHLLLTHLPQAYDPMTTITYNWMAQSLDADDLKLAATKAMLKMLDATVFWRSFQAKLDAINGVQEAPKLIV